MIVSIETLLELPIGTFFHEVELESCPVLVVTDHTNNRDDIIASPLFNGQDQAPRRIGFREMSVCERNSKEWYILSVEDRKKIASQMGFQGSGITVIGLK